MFFEEMVKNGFTHQHMNTCYNGKKSSKRESKNSSKREIWRNDHAKKKRRMNSIPLGMKGPQNLDRIHSLTERSARICQLTIEELLIFALYIEACNHWKKKGEFLHRYPAKAHTKPFIKSSYDQKTTQSFSRDSGLVELNLQSGLVISKRRRSKGARGRSKGKSKEIPETEEISPSLCQYPFTSVHFLLKNL